MLVLILILQVRIGLASIRDTQAQLHTGHQDIRTYFSSTTAAELTTTTKFTANPTPTTDTALHRTLRLSPTHDLPVS
jgi:hypothetical protein